MRLIVATLTLSALATMPGLALAQTSAQSGTSDSAPAAVTHAAPTHGIIAPRTPGGTSAGAVQGDQGRMNATVGGIDNHLLEQEKDRPRLPGQAPSPSQTLPGGTASGQTPH